MSQVVTMTPMNMVVADHSREQWEGEKTSMELQLHETQTKLNNMENQLRWTEVKITHDNERCTAAEERLTELRRERESMRRTLEEHQAASAYHHTALLNANTRVKDLQGQLDHLQGKSSLSFPSFGSLEELQKKNTFLDSENTRLVNDLKKRAMEFETKIRALTLECTVAREEASELRARVAELEILAGLDKKD